MKISDLKRKVVAIYAGRFHPFHIGHAQAFAELQAKFGAANTYIATSSKVEPPKSPFSFEEKLLMITAAGVDAGRVSQEITPYAPMNLPQSLGLNPDKDVMIFAVGKKDMDEDPRFAFTPLKDGTPAFFQPYTGNENNLKPFSNKKFPNGTRAGHGYVYQVKDYKFTIAGTPAGSASKIRELYVNSDDATRLQIIMDLYPASNESAIKKIKRIFDAKLVS